jgi:hypothetical protein
MRISWSTDRGAPPWCAGSNPPSSGRGHRAERSGPGRGCAVPRRSGSGGAVREARASGDTGRFWAGLRSIVAVLRRGQDSPGGEALRRRRAVLGQAGPCLSGVARAVVSGAPGVWASFWVRWTGRGAACGSVVLQSARHAGVIRVWSGRGGPGGRAIRRDRVVRGRVAPSRTCPARGGLWCLVRPGCGRLSG